MDTGAIVEVLAFADITVHPYTELLDIPRASHHRGGPDWPNWDEPSLARYWGSQTVLDVRPVPAAPVTSLPSGAWAGAALSHFGHMIADFSTRILPSRRLWPSTPLVFAAHRRDGFTSPATHPAFAGMLEWFGVPVDAVHIVTVPTLVHDLRVVRQQEKWMTPPFESYLDLLDENMERNGAAPRPGPPVYVSRAGMAGRLAGEEELEAALLRAGVRVIRPETLPLREQLETYLTADPIVFAEGSAVHALQLLGRGLGDVVVVNRRPGATIAKPGLSARARSVTYLDALRGHVHGLTTAGQPALGLGLAVLDPARLLDMLTPVLGKSLRQTWDEAAFRRAVAADLAYWLDRETGAGRADLPGARDQIEATIRAAGLGSRT